MQLHVNYGMLARMVLTGLKRKHSAVVMGCVYKLSRHTT